MSHWLSLPRCFACLGVKGSLRAYNLNSDDMSHPADTCQPGCRIQLGELLASALPVPDSLPITKPLLPSHTSLSPPPSGPAAVPASAPLPPQHHMFRAVGNALDHGGPPAIAPAPDPAHDAAATDSEGPCKTALQDVQPSCSHRLGEEAVRAPGGSLKGVAPAAYSTLQAVSFLAVCIRVWYIFMVYA